MKIDIVDLFLIGVSVVGIICMVREDRRQQECAFMSMCLNPNSCDGVEPSKEVQEKDNG